MNYKEEIEKIKNKISCKIIFYPNLAAFPEVGKEDRLYIDKSNGSIYIWNGTTYITN